MYNFCSYISLRAPKWIRSLSWCLWIWTINMKRGNLEIDELLMDTDIIVSCFLWKFKNIWWFYELGNETSIIEFWWKLPCPIRICGGKEFISVVLIGHDGSYLAYSISQDRGCLLVSYGVLLNQKWLMMSNDFIVFNEIYS